MVIRSSRGCAFYACSTSVTNVEIYSKWGYPVRLNSVSENMSHVQQPFKQERVPCSQHPMPMPRSIKHGTWQGTKRVHSLRQRTHLADLSRIYCIELALDRALGQTNGPQKPSASSLLCEPVRQELAQRGPSRAPPAIPADAL